MPAGVSDVVYKLSGIVSYSDGTWDPFEITYANSTFIDTFSATSLEAGKQLTTDKLSTLNTIWALLPGTHTITATAPSTDKTVNDFVLSVSGRISKTDGTWDDWTVQYSLQSVVDVASSTAYSDALTSFTSTIDAAMERVFGTGKVSIA